MKDELTRLRAVRDAILRYDTHATKAALHWSRQENVDASIQEELADRAKKAAVRLAGEI
jgi:hypothetical protein